MFWRLLVAYPIGFSLPTTLDSAPYKSSGLYHTISQTFEAGHDLYTLGQLPRLMKSEDDWV